MSVEKFCDFADEKPLEGEKVKIDNILGKEITVLAYQIAESKFRRDSTSEYLKLQFELDGKKHIIFTGSGVLARQCEKYKEHLPFTAVIVKPDRYYTFS